MFGVNLASEQTGLSRLRRDVLELERMEEVETDRETVRRHFISRTDLQTVHYQHRWFILSIMYLQHVQN